MGNKIKTIFNSDHKLSTDSENFYKNYWSDSNEISDLTTERNRRIIKTFFPKGLINKNILEIGVGGEGGVILQLKKQNNVFGVDVSDSAIRNSKQFGLDVVKNNLDTEILSFDDKYFDVVFAFEVFEHFSNPQHALEEIKRVLNENAILLISIPNKYTYHWPRLFYSVLFDRENFYDFLLINEFKVELHNDYFVKNMFQSTNYGIKEKSWSLYYYCEKLSDSDSNKYFDAGLHFWNKKDDNKIRINPIEALDMFKKSYMLDKTNYQAKLYLTHALLFRAIYNDQDDFFSRFTDLYTNLNNHDDVTKADHIFRILMIAIEAQRYSYPVLNDKDMNNLIDFLSNVPFSKKYLGIIQEEIERNSLIYNNEEAT